MIAPFRHVRPHVNRFNNTYGPHGETERMVVSAPAGWAYHVSGLNIILYRPSAPTTSGYIQVRLKLYEGTTLINEFYRFLTKIDALDANAQVTVPLNMVLIGNRTIHVFTIDASAGGTVEYIIHLFGYHFL